jgi:D-alanyl-D-alanine carboxypeptidase
VSAGRVGGLRGRRILAPAGAVGAVLLAAVTLAGCGQSEQERRAAESAASAASAAASSSAAAASSSAASARSAAAAASSSAASAASAAAASRLAEQSRSAVAASSSAQSAAESAASAASVAAAAALAAGADPADPDTPGEEGDAGRCAGYEQYADEEPTGMRTDAAAAWLAVRAAGEVQGLTMCLADGKRSRAQQQQTYDDYVRQYGQAMADQYVLPPQTSAHVLGLAIDVQPYEAYTWLEGTNGALSFCRIYDNEAWHFEFDPSFATAGCPARLPYPGAPTASATPSTS